MKFLILILFSKFTFAQNQQCLQLNGKWAGDCIYQSQQYGNLAGEIEFLFQQNSCSQISINGNPMNIPGQFKDEETSGFDKTRTLLDLYWTDYRKNKLGYDYEYHFVKNGTIKDEVKLKGYFFFNDKVLNLVQQGTVDRDKVKIMCRLRLSR